MSLINFLHSKLKPSVECDAVCEDGYAATNLIADDAEQLSRGFMAFSVTKPPVEMIFDFPKALEVKVIKLWNNIGSFCSSSFELHGKYEGIWERVAFVRDIDKGVDFVTFCYQSDYSSRSNSSNASAEQKNAKVFFFKTAHKILANTKSIKIIIRATYKCPPVLRKIQVWGLPARSLEIADRELVKSIWNEITNPIDFNACQQSGQRSPVRTAPELNRNSRLQIPEEFLDEITWELMIFPTVLPSGKIVDQSTIDRHSEEEAKWGRMPSDPFTGLEFTHQRKAILNLALKSEIEKFLMDNSEHFKTVPRCLGSSRVRRSRNRHASQIANIYQSHNTASVGAYSSLSTASYKRTSSTLSSATATQSTPSGPIKRTKYSDSLAYQTDLSYYVSTATQTSVTATASVAGLKQAPSTFTSSGLDLAVQDALSKITRFTEPLNITKPSTCICCSSEDFWYKIKTCKHLVCRKCIVQLTVRQKCVCKTSFCNADITRYHML